MHLHLQSGEQATLAFAHVQFEQIPLHKHLTSSRQALDTSGMVIKLVTRNSIFWSNNIVHRGGKHLLHLYAGRPNSSLIHRMFAMLW